MRKILLIFLFSISLFAIDVKYAAALDIAQSKRLNLFIEKEQLIIDTVNNYLLETGDFNSSNIEQKILSYYDDGSGVVNNNFFTNFDGQKNGITVQLDVTLTVPYSINLFIKGIINNQNKSKNIINKYINSPSRDTSILISFDNTTGESIMTVPLNSSVQKLFNTYAQINALGYGNSVYIGNSKPANTSLTWYLPNGKGGYDVYFYDNGISNWKKAGNPFGEGLYLPNKNMNIKVLPGAVGYFTN